MRGAEMHGGSDAALVEFAFVSKAVAGPARGGRPAPRAADLELQRPHGPDRRAAIRRRPVRAGDRGPAAPSSCRSRRASSATRGTPAISITAFRPLAARRFADWTLAGFDLGAARRRARPAAAQPASLPAAHGGRAPAARRRVRRRRRPLSARAPGLTFARRGASEARQPPSSGPRVHVRPLPSPVPAGCCGADDRRAPAHRRRRGGRPAARPLAAPAPPARAAGPHRAHVPQGRDPRRRRPRPAGDPARRRPDRAPAADPRGRRRRAAPARRRLRGRRRDDPRLRDLARRRRHRAEQAAGPRGAGRLGAAAARRRARRGAAVRATRSRGWCTGSTATPRACCCSRAARAPRRGSRAPSRRATRARSTGRRSPGVPSPRAGTIRYGLVKAPGHGAGGEGEKMLVVPPDARRRHRGRQARHHRLRGDRGRRPARRLGGAAAR